MKKIVIIFLGLVLCLLNTNIAQAIQTSRPLPIDSRFRVITYLPGGIHKYVGYYDYQASIILEEGETVSTIAMGVTSGWYINPIGNRIFIKPISNDPIETNTNVLMITNKRTYHIILEAAEAKNMEDPDLVWETTFVYPQTEDEILQQISGSSPVDLNDKDKNYNFNYTVSGSDVISPLKIFDDGEFTYFQFPKVNADIPAFFLVDFEGNESIINYRVEGDYIVLERVTSQLTLRMGPNVTCIFNENRPLKTPLSKRRK